MNGITRYDPFNELTRFDPFLDMEDMFDRAMMRPILRRAMETGPQIKMDVKEADGQYLVNAEIPGVNKDDIHVTIDGNRVSISAEVKHEKETKKASRWSAASAVMAWPRAASAWPTRLIRVRYRPNTTTACLS